MVFLTQPLYRSGSFGETKFKCMERSKAVKSSTDPPLELKLILNPPTITNKNTLLLLLSDICSLQRFLSHQVQKVSRPLVYLGDTCLERHQEPQYLKIDLYTELLNTYIQIGLSRNIKVKVESKSLLAIFLSWLLLVGELFYEQGKAFCAHVAVFRCPHID